MHFSHSSKPFSVIGFWCEMHVWMSMKREFRAVNLSLTFCALIKTPLSSVSSWALKTTPWHMLSYTRVLRYLLQWFPISALPRYDWGKILLSWRALSRLAVTGPDNSGRGSVTVFLVSFFSYSIFWRTASFCNESLIEAICDRSFCSCCFLPSWDFSCCT